MYVLNVVDGCMPADMATGSAEELEEERRLLYVAMTRARDQLQLLVPQRFYVTQQSARGDRHLWGGLSRFIPPQVAACFERVCCRAARARRLMADDGIRSSGLRPGVTGAFDLGLMPHQQALGLFGRTTCRTPTRP